MLTKNGYHLTYCTNVHPAENWDDVFLNLKNHLPEIKNKVAPNQSFGVGLYLSNTASQQILEGDHLRIFQEWLNKHDLYVFTMNGFPYGGFHDKYLKDKVYRPDWTQQERVDYTNRLFNILSKLLPDDLIGGVSTVPVSYKFWFNDGNSRNDAYVKAAENIMKVVKHLYKIHSDTGKVLHLDIEPEPDCLLENSKEFIDFYDKYLIPAGMKMLSPQLALPESEVISIIKKHVTVCYDICHFAVEYEDHESALYDFASHGISIGKIQISAALQASSENCPPGKLWAAFQSFVEPTYLHQTVLKDSQNGINKYRDLDQAIASSHTDVKEWRTHFHVPIFRENYGILQSTQDEIVKVLTLLKENNFTNHLEVETYTWEVLPADLKNDLIQSISRELNWVIKELN